MFRFWPNCQYRAFSFKNVSQLVVICCSVRISTSHSKKPGSLKACLYWTEWCWKHEYYTTSSCWWTILVEYSMGISYSAHCTSYSTACKLICKLCDGISASLLSLYIYFFKIISFRSSGALCVWKSCSVLWWIFNSMAFAMGNILLYSIDYYGVWTLKGEFDRGMISGFLWCMAWQFAPFVVFGLKTMCYFLFAIMKITCLLMITFWFFHALGSKEVQIYATYPS